MDPKPDSDRILAVKKAAQARLLGIPGVHAVAVGAKIVGGQPTDEPTIAVFVLKKKPASELPEAERIPAEIDGIKTDVVEQEIPRLAVEDEIRYRPLIGGVQIAGNPLNTCGTLGFIARTNEPEPKIVGVTNHHVVGMVTTAAPSNIVINLIAAANTLRFEGDPSACFVFLGLRVSPPPPPNAERVDVIWRNAPGSTLSDIAKKGFEAITALNHPAVSAAATGPDLQIIAAPGFTIDIADRDIYGLHVLDQESSLSAQITGTSILLTGKAAGNYGIFTNINVGGHDPSYGVFTPVARGAELHAVASDIASAITARGIPGVTASTTGSQIVVSGALEVECDVFSNVLVGQAKASFCCTCSACCHDRIGRVLDARLDLDAAVIQLDGGLQYKAEIHGKDDAEPRQWVVVGSHEIAANEVPPYGIFKVKKRGRTTRDTYGTVKYLHKDGIIALGELPPPGSSHLASFLWHLFQRRYVDALEIEADGPTFLEAGDSGSAIVTDTGGAVEIVGLGFGSGGNTANATPINQVLAAFDLSVETATVLGVVKTVPKVGVHPFAALEPEPIAGGIGLGAAPVLERLREAQEEVTATPLGRKIASAVRRHIAEGQQLVAGNRRVGTVWQRSGGPQLVQALLSMGSQEDPQLPAELNGRPIKDCLKKIQDALIRYGSEALSADLRELGPTLIELSTLTYAQVLSALRTPVGPAASEG